MANTLKNIFERLLSGIHRAPVAKRSDHAKPEEKRAFARTSPDIATQQPQHTRIPSQPNPSSPRSRNAFRRSTRAGIPVIDPSEDLYRLFSEHDPTPSTTWETDRIPAADKPGRDTMPSDIRTRPGQALKPKRKPQKDRHGIDLLNASDDLSHAFVETQNDSGSDIEFGRLVDKTLSGADYQEMIRAKKMVFPSGRKPGRRAARVFPPPRAELDLHGCTAARGERMADAFIRSARAKELDAIRIIVGRGLHSDGGAVLPDMVESLTKVLKKQGIVDSFRWEGGVKTRSGAILVYPAAHRNGS